MLSCTVHVQYLALGGRALLRPSRRLSYGLLPQLSHKPRTVVVLPGLGCIIHNFGCQLPRMRTADAVCSSVHLSLCCLALSSLSSLLRLPSSSASLSSVLFFHWCVSFYSSPPWLCCRGFACRYLVSGVFCHSLCLCFICLGVVKKQCTRNV